MLRFVVWPIVALFLCFATGAEAGSSCPKAAAPQAATSPAPPALEGLAPLIERLCPACFQLSESGKGCTESCISQCRDAERSCSGDRAGCKAQAQLCARRCVVTCGNAR